eukprot:12485361-Alexandrium_andersonii.AAC.1
MDDATDTERCVVETASARLTSGEPEARQRRGTQRPPARRRSGRSSARVPGWATSGGWATRASPST